LSRHISRFHTRYGPRLHFRTKSCVGSAKAPKAPTTHAKNFPAGQQLPPESECEIGVSNQNPPSDDPNRSQEEELVDIDIQLDSSRLSLSVAAGCYGAVFLSGIMAVHFPGKGNMEALARCNRISAHGVSAAAWGLLCSLIVAAPLLSNGSSHTAGAVLYLLFSPICHQMPERSFFVAAFPLAVCQRCTGIYLGLFLGSLPRNPLLRRIKCRPGRWTLAASCPLAADALATAAGLWTGSSATRLLTGLLFGIIASSLLILGLDEFIRESAAPVPTKSRVKGDLS